MPRLTLGSSNCDSMKLHCLMLLCKIVTTRWMLPCKTRSKKKGMQHKKSQMGHHIGQIPPPLLE